MGIVIMGRGYTTEINMSTGTALANDDASVYYRLVMKLKKQLGFIQVFCIAAGAMISSGIFILPGLAFTRTGPSVFISYTLAGIVALTSVLSICELTSAMPKAGGDYFFITRSVGILVGTVSGFFSWLALSLKSAFAIIGITEVLVSFFPLNRLIVSLAVCLLFVILNITGIKEAGWLQVALVAGLVGIMILFIAAGFPSVSMRRFEPFATSGLTGVITTTGFVFVSYGGLLKVTSVSEEVKNPTRNIPLALLASLFVTMFLYVFMLIVTIGVMKPAELASSMTPIADAAAVFMGKPGFIVLTIGSFLAFVTTVNAGIMSASRYPMAMSRDGLLPRFIAKTNRRFGTPIRSILITGAFIAVFLMVDFSFMVKAASTFFIVNYILSNLSLIVLRESKIHNYRPSFRSPLYPWVQIAGIVCFFFLLSNMGLTTIITASVVIAVSLILYLTYGRKEANKEFALLHLISRITDRKIAVGNLEEELKEIIYERDEIAIDRFDTLVANAKVLDLGAGNGNGEAAAAAQNTGKGEKRGRRNGPDEARMPGRTAKAANGDPPERPRRMTAEAFFSLAADLLWEEAGLPRDEVYRLFIERERQSSTAISPFIAIPHIVIPGTGRFSLLLVRSKEGIHFTEEHDAVKAVFLLMGSGDERNFHLRSLSAIAQIVQEQGFEERWLGGKTERSLRDTILLGKRKRN
jgi:amino acid transporter/mannitol/fructose-specific phosphotransferase system IIA component (Ntr-type)